MATISLPGQLLLYSGPTLDLRTAPFLGNIKKVFRYNSGGTTLVGFDPTKQVNAFTALENGKSYVVQSLTVPYEIPTTSTDPKPDPQLVNFTLAPEPPFSA